MIKRPDNNRSQLTWSMFKQTENGDWLLSLPPYYAELFSEINNDLVTKYELDWKDTKTGNNKRVYIKDISNDDILKVKEFIANFGSYVLINLNKNIESYYSDELDYCMALDFIHTKETGIKMHTEIGKLVHTAKHDDSANKVNKLNAVNKLAKRMIKAIRQLPKPELSINKRISYVPFEKHKEFDIPSKISEIISEKLKDSFFILDENPLLRSELIISKPAFKNLNFEKKILEWDKIYNQSGVKLSGSVNDYTVYVIDDLYQSGVTIWSYAKFLKSKGASHVIGLVCEKTWGDTDNIYE